MNYSGDVEKVWKAINDIDKHVVVQVASAVRVSIGDEFNMEIGQDVTGKLVTALKIMGFDKVFDTNFSADLTVMEIGTELVHRIQNKDSLPMITSCCPEWVNYIETKTPKHIKHLSGCKSPQQMFGAIVKSYYSKKEGINPKDIFTVSIMPCLGNKYEASREEMNINGEREVDAVLTTRELAEMINFKNISFKHMEETEFDAPFGTASGSGVIFDTNGGVTEGVLRTVYHRLRDENLKDVEFKDVRGMDGIKEATIIVNNFPVKFAVVNGFLNVKKILEEIESGRCEYVFIEVTACIGGCIGVGGQSVEPIEKIKEKRLEQIYRIDEKKTIRKSFENQGIIDLYRSYLGQPFSELSRRLLHTTYFPRENKI
ncbi:MAG: [Fe-Fe] hydrogenase large subunit C-terminal domain-containing protein [Clostridiaceae bacterium]